MSVQTVTARVAELEALIGGTSSARPVAEGFDGQLAAATRALPPVGAAQPVAGGAAVGGAAPGGAATPFAAEIDAAATRHGVDPALLRALIRQESNFNPQAQSPAGARGLTQLMPATARSLGVSNPLEPVQAIDGGARYLRQQLDRFGGDERLALAAYNAGPGAVQRFGGVPPYAETQAYVQRVLAYAEQYRGQAR